MSVVCKYGEVIPKYSELFTANISFEPNIQLLDDSGALIGFSCVFRANDGVYAELYMKKDCQERLDMDIGVKYYLSPVYSVANKDAFAAVPTDVVIKALFLSRTPRLSTMSIGDRGAFL